jgi:hypothetical protein
MKVSREVNIKVNISINKLRWGPLTLSMKLLLDDAERLRTTKLEAILILSYSNVRQNLGERLFTTLGPKTQRRTTLADVVRHCRTSYDNVGRLTTYNVGRFFV